MKFDFCIGNPPYQDTTLGDNETYAPPVYDKFMDAAYTVADKVQLIHPARFLFNAGSTPKAWNQKMLSDEHFKVQFYTQKSAEVFKNTDIKGGVCVTYRDRTKDFGAIEIFTPYDELNSIKKKVEQYDEFQSFSSIVFTRTAYRLTTTLHKEHPEAIGMLSNGHAYDMSTNIFDRLPHLFFDNKPNDNEEYIQIFGLMNKIRSYRWIKKKYVNNPIDLEKWKIFIPKANGSGSIGEVLSTPLIGQPLIGHTESFMSIGAFDTEEEVKSCYKYICSKFARTCLGILKITQDNPPEKWKYVPLQDFTPNSDIDWSQSIADIDKQLYKKYGLSQEEIDFIETKVKEMN